MLPTLEIQRSELAGRKLKKSKNEREVKSFIFSKEQSEGNSHDSDRRHFMEEYIKVYMCHLTLKRQENDTYQITTRKKADDKA